MRGRSDRSILDLIEAGFLTPGDQLRFRKRADAIGVVADDGSIEVMGVTYSSPTAATLAFTAINQNGWTAWFLPEGQTLTSLADLRTRLRSDS